MCWILALLSVVSRACHSHRRARNFNYIVEGGWLADARRHAHTSCFYARARIYLIAHRCQSDCDLGKRYIYMLFELFCTLYVIQLQRASSSLVARRVKAFICDRLAARQSRGAVRLNYTAKCMMCTVYTRERDIDRCVAAAAYIYKSVWLRGWLRSHFRQTATAIANQYINARYVPRGNIL